MRLLLIAAVMRAACGRESMRVCVWQRREADATSPGTRRRRLWRCLGSLERTPAGKARADERTRIGDGRGERRLVGALEQEEANGACAARRRRGGKGACPLLWLALLDAAACGGGVEEGVSLCRRQRPEPHAEIMSLSSKRHFCKGRDRSGVWHAKWNAMPYAEKGPRGRGRAERSE